MRIASVVACAASLWCAGCAQESSEPLPSPRPAVAAVAGGGCPAYVVPESVLAVPVLEMRDALHAAYRLTPDRRFLAAVGELHRFFVPSASTESASASFEQGRWRLCHAGRMVGDLPELASFADWMQLLRGWRDGLAAAHPLRFGVADPQDLAQARSALERYRLSDAVNVLQALDARWAAGQRAPEDPQIAARAYAIIGVQMLDRVELADAVTGSAIAMLALAGGRGQSDMRREEAMLAWQTGHRAHARGVAASLPPQDPLRLYQNNHDADLLAVAAAPTGTAEARYLHLLRLGELRRREDWLAWTRQHFDNRAELHVLRTALEFGDFDFVRSFGPMMSHATAGAVGVWSVEPRLHAEIVRLLDLSLYGLLLQQAASVLEQFGPTAIGRFETSLDAHLRDRGGPFLPAHTERALYRGYFYSGVHVLGEFYREQLSSVGATEDFARFIGREQRGVAAQFGAWYASLAESKAGRIDAARLFDDLATLDGLGARPLQATLDELLQRTAFGDMIRFRAARRMVARLDDRLEHREYLAGVARDSLFDLPLFERLYRSIVASVDQPHVAAWLAAFTDDEPALRAALQSPAATSWVRLRAIEHLRAFGASTDELDREYRALLHGAPDQWSLLSRYVDHLARTGRSEQARAEIRRWLDTTTAPNDFPALRARRRLAELHYEAGQISDGLDAIRPALASWVGGALQIGALLLSADGRTAEAEAMAFAMLRRYPDSDEAFGVVLQVLWQHGKFAEAARQIRERPYAMNATVWEQQIGTPFVRVFGAEPARGLEAFAALQEAGVDPYDLRGLITPIYRAGHHELAHRTMARLRAGGLGGIELQLRAYLYRRAWKGQDDALRWLQGRIPPQMHNPAGMIAYAEGLDELLWDLVREPEKGQHADAVWLYRAAAFVRGGAAEPRHREALETYYARAPRSLYDTAGAYLLGKVPASQLVALVGTDNQRAEVAYYLGLRALAEGRLEEASDWYRSALETGLIRMGETRWAYSQLVAWAGHNKSLRLVAAR